MTSKNGKGIKEVISIVIKPFFRKNISRCASQLFLSSDLIIFFPPYPARYPMISPSVAPIPATIPTNTGFHSPPPKKTAITPGRGKMTVELASKFEVNIPI